jgi:hypothetical protein
VINDHGPAGWWLVVRSSATRQALMQAAIKHARAASSPPLSLAIAIAMDWLLHIHMNLPAEQSTITSA